MSQDLLYGFTYDLPEGWRFESFKKVVINLDGQRIPIKSDERKSTHGTYPYYGATGIIDYVDEYIFDGENLLISEDGANLVARKYPIAFIATGKYWVNNHAHVVCAKPEVTTNSYLKWFFAWFDLSSYITGAAQPKLSQGKLNSIQIPLPPLAEQTRIVEKLDAVLSRIDTAIDELQQSLTLVDAMFKSGLDGVFEDIYAHSAIKKLSELTTKIGSGATPKGGGSAYKESGISLIRSLNVHDLNFKYDGLAFIDDEQAKALSNVEVSSGDVLLNITGASIARCCIVPDAILPARVNQHVCILRPNHLLNSEFLNYLIVSPKFKSALLFQGAGGATRQALTKTMIENFDIPLLTLDKQIEVIETIKQLNDKTTQLKTEISTKIGMFNQLKASVLDGAFRGLI
jgi:type I restriction enzyme S subunit